MTPIFRIFDKETQTFLPIEEKFVVDLKGHLIRLDDEVKGSVAPRLRYELYFVKNVNSIKNCCKPKRKQLK